MTPSSIARTGALLVGALLILSAAQSAKADTSVGGTNAWTMITPPSFPALGGFRVGAVTYVNNLNVTVTGIVIMVVRNSLNQTVYYSTATLSLPSGENGTADLVLSSLSPTNYNATFFAFTFAGVAITNSTTASLTIPEP
jgi:hypothetical protein